MEIVDKRGHYFKVVDMPRPLKALNGKVGITLEDEDGFRFTTESRNSEDYPRLLLCQINLNSVAGLQRLNVSKTIPLRG